MSNEQHSWQDAYKSTLSPEELAAAARTRKWIWAGAIVLVVWIAVVLLAFTVFGTQ